jgi:hypothetical protein
MERASAALLSEERDLMRHAIRTAAVLALLLLVSRASAQAADKAQTLSGTISRLDAAQETLVVKVGAEETKFVWNAETRINGVLAPGAKVTVRYAPQPDGQNLAFQISVGR